MRCPGQGIGHGFGFLAFWGGVRWVLREAFGHRRAVLVALRGAVPVGGWVLWVHGCEEPPDHRKSVARACCPVPSLSSLLSPAPGLLNAVCFCFLGCPEGWFGASCRHRCQCEHGAACDHVSGACTCSSGWRGTFCEHRTYPPQGPRAAGGSHSPRSPRRGAAILLGPPHGTGDPAGW